MVLRVQLKKLNFWHSLICTSLTSFCGVNPNWIPQYLLTQYFQARMTYLGRTEPCTAGAVFIGVRNDIIATEEVRLDVHNCEIITVSIKLAKTKSLLLSSCYRPPAPDTNALDLLDDVSSRIYSSSPPLVVLAGDFNCGGIDWSTRNLMPGIAQACDQALLDLSDKYGLTQHVSSPNPPRLRPNTRPCFLL